MKSVVGMGVPSKYLDFPVASFGRDETVTLNRARRESPQRTKKASRRLSRGVRIPRVNATAEGATPKEIYVPGTQINLVDLIVRDLDISSVAACRREKGRCEYQTV